MKLKSARAPLVHIAIATAVAATAAIALGSPGSAARVSQASEQDSNQVLEWNRIFVETLIATNTPNSSSQRLGAIVHTAIFDAYNGIERRYTSIFVRNVDGNGERLVTPGASRRAAVIAAAYTTLVGLFPAREQQLSDSYAASLAALSDDGGDGGQSRERGIAWGTQVAQAVLAWRAADGVNTSYPPFTGGTAVGQWRPIPPATAMSAQGLAFTAPFVVESNTQFRPDPPRTLASATYTQDFNAVKALGRKTGSTRTDAQTALAPFWEGNASVHWNQAANQIARANHLSISDSNRLLAVLNIAMADTALTIWSAKRHYGANPAEVTWRPLTAITLAGTDGIAETAPDLDWLPLVTTPSHPEYPAGHPALNGAAATVLLSQLADLQTFTLTTSGQPSQTYTSISQARADGNDARIWGGMHYPSTVLVSDATGEAIAHYVDANSIQLLRDQQKRHDRNCTTPEGA
jgi:membrane-associated phospholipid phosphatase